MSMISSLPVELSESEFSYRKLGILPLIYSTQDLKHLPAIHKEAVRFQKRFEKRATTLGLPLGPLFANNYRTFLTITFQNAKSKTP
jgi:hypothetical protein